MTNPLRKYPWLFFFAAFVALLAAWSVFITIAVKNAPETVPLENPDPKAAAAAHHGS